MSETIDVVDPATGKVIGTIPAGAPADIDRVVGAARAALPGWARTDAAQRGSRLKAAARRLRDHARELAELQTRESGKPLGDSRGGVDAGINTIEQYAELGPLHRGRSLVGSWGASDMQVHEPRGVAAVLVPWNDPIAIACGSLAACLVTGNTVVFKPSEKTPLSSVRLAELINEDLPPGVLNLLLGDNRAGAPLVAHPGVDLVMHTGSTATGRQIAATCARQLKKCVLELGGKDALIVDAGVDPDWAAGQAATGAFANAGQICTSVERIYVHADVADRFVDALTERARALRVGPGMDGATEMGPLIDERQREIVHAHVSDAIERGAELRAGGGVPDGADGGGFFYAPTVVVGADDDMALMREETFGPVASVRVVESFDQALELANASDYGLAATVLTASDRHAERAWRELEVGTVKVNAVFGGAPGGSAQPHKRSGMGYGYGPELLDEVTTTKVVHVEAAVTPLR
jgi:succinate-semialdehyde dehydrogenase/glutarate-semialdehyde dehydrogenase